MVTQFERWSTSLPAKAPHAQLVTKTHQEANAPSNDQDKLMAPAESERGFHESNGINRNMLVLPPRILIARSTLDNVDHATRQTQLTIKLTAYSSEATDHCHARDDIETKRTNRCPNRHELTQPQPQTNGVHSICFGRTPKHECKEC